MGNAIMINPPSSGSEEWTSSSLKSKWSYSIFPNNYELDYDCENMVGYIRGGKFTQVMVESAFENARRIKKITLRNLFKTLPERDFSLTVSFAKFANKDSYYGGFDDNLEEVSIPNYTIYPSECRDAFFGRTKLKKVDILFNLSLVAAYDKGYHFGNMFGGCSSLEEVRFVPNSILWMNYQIFNVSQHLSDNSLVSIANGLAENSTSNTLKLLSTPYARCSTLMGNVNSDRLFEINEQGTTSLADFIANTKGWNLSL